MKRAVVTMAFGTEWEKILELTHPRIDAFAKRNKMDFIVMNRSVMDPMDYNKSMIAHILVTKNYDQVIYIDCDCLVTKDCDDFANVAEEGNGGFIAFDEGDFLDRKEGMKRLAAEFGGLITPSYYFNFGVFAMTRKHLGLLSLPPIGVVPNHFGMQTWANIQAHFWDIPLSGMDPAYNCMTSVEAHYGLDRYKDAMIIHYAGQSGDLAKLAEQIKVDDAKLVELGR